MTADDRRSHMSGSSGTADAINATAAIQFLMSPFGGEADVRGTVPKSPLVAKSGHCDVVGWEPSIASEADLGMKLGSRSFPISASLGCAPSSRVRIIQTVKLFKTCPKEIIPKTKKAILKFSTSSLSFLIHRIFCLGVVSFHHSTFPTRTRG